MRHAALATESEAQAVAVRYDGTVIAAGYANTILGQVFVTVSYTPNGAAGSPVTTDIASGDDYAQAIALQQAERSRQQEIAKIEANKAIKVADIEREKVLEAERISKEQVIETAHIEKVKAVEAAELEKQVVIASKEADKLRGFIASHAKKLENASFVDRAPPEVVQAFAARVREFAISRYQSGTGCDVRRGPGAARIHLRSGRATVPSA